MNNNLNFKFNSLQWEYKNTHLVMPARRPFYPPSLWRTGGFDPKFTSTPILTIFPLKLILFFFTLVFMGSSSFVKDFPNWV